MQRCTETVDPCNLSFNTPTQKLEWEPTTMKTPAVFFLDARDWEAYARLFAANGGPDVVYVGHYNDELVRENSVWKFKLRTVSGDITRR